MDAFTHHSLITSPYQLTYSYYLSPAFSQSLTTSPSSPILLLLHGFPDHAFMWSDAIPALTTLGFPMIIPNLLGFGGSSKPTHTPLYNYRQQACSLSQILEHEGVQGKRVIPIGHDWGSATAQRFFLYHRATAAWACPEPFDLTTANNETEKRFGYPQWAYWEFFTANDAPEVMRRNLGRFWEVNNGVYPSEVEGEAGRDIWMREMFCVRGAMRAYLEGRGKGSGGRSVKLKEYPEREKLKKAFVERLSRNGLEGPVQYYHSLANNTMPEDEKELCEKDENGKDKRVIDVPMLYIGQTGDWVCRTDLMDDAKNEGLVADLEEKVLQSSHWCLYEKGSEVGEVLVEWLGRRFGVR